MNSTTFGVRQWEPLPWASCCQDADHSLYLTRDPRDMLFQLCPHVQTSTERVSMQKYLVRERTNELIC